MFISKTCLVFVFQGDGAVGLPGPAGKQGEPGDRVGQPEDSSEQDCTV